MLSDISVGEGVYKMILPLVFFASVQLVLCRTSLGVEYLRQRTPVGARVSDNILEDAALDMPGLVKKYGYPIEIHDVITEDGYNLTMHRIPHGKDQNNEPTARRPIAFVMHGLLSSSADFVVLGPGDALAYVLAEAGYDVWLGNARGNYYSRRHIYLNPDDPFNNEFWKFTWEQIGTYDLPAFFDHIEKVTGQSKLHYIGHSQGGTTFFVLNSLKPEYNERFITFQGLAPGAFYENNGNAVYSSLMPYVKILEPIAFALYGGEVMATPKWVSLFSAAFCFPGSIFAELCQSFIVSGKSDYFNQTMIPVFLGHYPAGASVLQLVHYSQLVQTSHFKRFDYDPITNLLVYGSVVPPDYDLSQVTASCHIHYSEADTTVTPRDSEHLAAELPNSILHKIGVENFSHLDFMWGNKVEENLYEYMISLMREAEQSL